ncbi:MAG: hypothetical protein N2515_06060 [Deltaproteobacteria bacterium]|nr:hypothetical protein [Deltaproteobacteria bacterium]
MFFRKAAIRPIPRWAVVDEEAVLAVEAMLELSDEAFEQAMEQAYRQMEERQPTLTAWLVAQFTFHENELVQSVAFFLAVSVYMAFREAFPTRLQTIDAAQLELAIETFITDESIRQEDPIEVMETDDIIAVGQPAVVHFIQSHVDEAIGQAGENPPLDAFDHVYRSLLVEVVALSHAVSPPHGLPESNRWLA